MASRGLVPFFCFRYCENDFSGMLPRFCFCDDTSDVTWYLVRTVPVIVSSYQVYIYTTSVDFISCYLLGAIAHVFFFFFFPDVFLLFFPCHHGLIIECNYLLATPHKISWGRQEVVIGSRGLVPVCFFCFYDETAIVLSDTALSGNVKTL